MSHTPPIHFVYEEEIDPGRLPAPPLSTKHYVMMPKARYGALVEQRGDLLAACEGALESIGIARDTFGNSVAGGVFEGAFLGVEKELTAAIAKAEGD